MRILVTGATGNVGAPLVRELGRLGVDTRAFVRDPEKARQRLGDEVELAVGDFADPGSMQRALDGVDRVFLACGNVPGQVAMECAMIDAARSAGVSRLVKLSSPDPAIDAPLIFDRWHAEIEKHLMCSGIPAVALRPRTYMTNLLGYADTIAQTGTLFAPAGDARITFIDPRDVASAAATVLTARGPVDETYLLTGPEAIGFEQIAHDLSLVTGRSIRYVPVPDEAAQQAMLDAGLPAMVADFIVGVYRSQRAGSMSETNDRLLSLIERPHTFAQFAADHASAFGAGQPVGAMSIT